MFFISLCIKHYCFNPIVISYFFANHQQTMRPIYVNQMKMQIFFFSFLPANRLTVYQSLSQWELKLRRFWPSDVNYFADGNT